MRQFIINLTVFSFTILGSIFIIEFGIRMLFPQYDPSGHVVFTTNKDGVVLAKTIGKFRQIKNTGDYNVEILTSKLGLREPKKLQTSHSNDIFVVGDSFSFGWGVEENHRFSNQLQIYFPELKIFNISIPTNFDGYEKLLGYAKKHGAIIRRLIVSVTIENDLALYQNSASSKISASPKAEEESPLLFKKGIQIFKNFLRDNSAAYFLFTTQVHKIPFLQNVFTDLGLILPNAGNLMQNKLSNKVISSSADRLLKLVENYDARILIIPSRALWIGSDLNKRITREIHDKFILALDKRDLDYIDMRGPMENSKNPLQYHFKNDGHWNNYGHKLAAKILKDKISPDWK